MSSKLAISGSWRLLAATVTTISVMSNHYHLGVYDPAQNISKFVAELNRMVAKHHNAMYGRFENFWSSGKPSIIPLPTFEDLLDKLVYSLVNPVAADLVAHAEDWPGVISLPKDLCTTEVVERPDVYFRKDGTCPETVELEYVLPKLGKKLTVAKFRDRVAAALAEAEAKEAARRRASKTKVLGATAVRSQRRDMSPRTTEPRFVRDPHVAAKQTGLRKRLIAGLREFRKQYAQSLKRWVEGVRDVVFPPGTYWMVRHHRCRCGPATCAA